ncbi:MAG: glycoside hydrolase family 1 protein [Candidatus Yanofskybacteria bacterium]|nr:glycoside hydrolase family 1 protein [Candidatus Yanofskybacteria bacterium]
MIWKTGMKILLCLFVYILITSIFPWNKKIQKTIPNHPPPPITKGVDIPIIPEEKDLVLKDIEFPDNFFFGTASSDFQTTGGNGLTDWNLYIGTFKPPLIGPGKGTDFLNRYKEDFDLASDFNDEVHRLSLEWSRIEPEEGKFNSDAIKKYKEILSYAKQKGIDPMICLNHFALPLWIVEKGGLESSEFPFYYSRYAETVARRIGLPLKIKWWLTFNEPQVMLLPYTKGIWPPDKPVKNFQDSQGSQRALKVASHLIDAHRLSYRAIHQTIKDKNLMVSFASAPGSFYPNDPDSPLDQMAYNFFNMINTLLFDYSVGKTDRDFIGLNYYGRAKLKLHISWWENVLPWLTEKKPFAVEWKIPTQNKQGSRPKEFYPRGLYDLIMKFKDLNLPIVITENGLSDPDDKFREEFLVIHLKAVHDAISDGANVMGYQYWALTDTWEWDGAFSQMGLISIDRADNFTRKLRQSALTYREIIQSNKISKELLEKHKELLK